jgi:hypothetical protein
MINYRVEEGLSSRRGNAGMGRKGLCKVFEVLIEKC